MGYIKIALPKSKLEKQLKEILIPGCNISQQ